NALSTQATWNAGTWYFATVRWGSDGMKLYVNGVEEGSNSFTGAPDWADDGDLHFGADSDGTKAFYGSLDELRVSNVQKSATEILNDYKRGILNLRFQARSDDDNSSWGDFIGDYTTPPSNLSVENNRYFQYIVHFSTENVNYTPELYNVSINYEDTIGPEITFVSPTPANQNRIEKWALINVTLNENGSAATLEWNGANETMNGSEMNWYLNKTDLADGNYTFKVYAIDNLNNTGVSEEKWVNIYTPAPSQPTPVVSSGSGSGIAVPSPAPVPRVPVTETTSPVVEEVPAPTIETIPEVAPAAQPEQNVTRPPPSAFTVFVNTISSRSGIAVIGATALIIVLASFAIYRGIKSKPTAQSQQPSGENQPTEGQL
ncbi:TPA: hypothetical protein H1016_02215, partial [archaeon]|nr:hypothetical protein [Candidatus Naiadarchaeum limnaeum]